MMDRPYRIFRYLLAAVFIGASIAQTGSGWPLVVLGGLLGALTLLLWDQMSHTTERHLPKVSFDERLADGVVPIVLLPELNGTPNEIRPELMACRARDSLGPTPSSAKSRPIGRPLKGRLGVFTLFVGRDGGKWDDREVAEAFNALERMGRWLEREAIRWKIPLNVELIGTYFVADDPTEEDVEIAESLDPFETVLDERSADAKGIASASRAAAQLGYNDLAELILDVDPRADHDATLWIVNLLRAGRSSAVMPEDYGFPNVGIVLCYAGESPFSEALVGLPFVDPSTLVHEALHLFGATDKYGTSLKSFAGQQVTSHDVMRLGKSRLRELRIDPLTAAEIGWT
jgi:hypothetical protein